MGTRRTPLPGVGTRCDRTGASVVAVLRRTGVLPSPGPAVRLAPGDLPVAAGTRDGVEIPAAIAAGG
ncbi:cation:proton antiporter regulatory subunit [Streptomyces sp. NPDC093595]|uniref:cation:proton antiporter regulatory subunit n=1 Tax=Streptomyces sp. NPDC093595 TaxID=3366045 RepID=UPI00381BEA9D